MASPKAKGFENFDWTAYFASFDKCKVRPLDPESLNLSYLQPYIDKKVAHEFLEKGSELKDKAKEDGYVLVNGLTPGKGLKALYNYDEEEEEAEKVAHIRKCTAACAYWAITRKYTSQTIRDHSRFVLGLPPVVYRGALIKNALAGGYGLPRATDLYYIMNSGLEYMIQEFPLQTTALLAWRVHRGEYTLDNSDKEFTREMRLVINYHFSRAKALNQSKQEYFDNLKDQIKEYIVYLVKFTPAEKTAERPKMYKPIPKKSSNACEDLICCCIFM